MRVALLTEGGYPYAQGELVAWCERLVRALPWHDFEVRALSRGRAQARGPRRPLPPQVRLVRTAPLWGPPPGGRPSRPAARGFAEAFEELTAGLSGEAGAAGGVADRFARGLYALADLAAGHGGLARWLASDASIAVLEAACRRPGAPRAAVGASVADLLTVAERLERALRPLSLDWYAERPADPGLGTVDVCHAVGGGPAALPGLLARHFHGTPLLVTEFRVRLREHHLAALAGAVGHAVPPSAARAPVRALLAAFQLGLARAVYAAAALITPGDARAGRWQRRCGADPARQRPVWPGVPAGELAAVAERTAPSPHPLLVTAGPVDERADADGRLRAMARVRAAEPAARLLVLGGPPPEPGAVPGVRWCPPGAVAHRAAPDAAARAAGWAAGTLAVLADASDGFPTALVEAMCCGRAVVAVGGGSTAEVLGEAGVLVEPGDPAALADACLALLRDPARRARLGAAARARATTRFSVEHGIATVDACYAELAGPAAARPLPRRARGRAGARPSQAAGRRPDALASAEERS
ncbi:DUF3492 domain-containing protein [Streptomyces sp. 3MP-14]|uniref:D-inositol 3-phosphate glycosyltransferase n=1 Tax=Streptomyces mimosae TaxID=2586635 RepID=A0A5N6A8Z0_9ACTN|nr:MULTISPECIES: DUF3492 domain-containing protein [Streptomyces]KAB8165101.1 DUF3492 domain-containing protein [Streptomyces mimosae]KAB8175733.1 DUF3492 domain-containing protein [Streptomyces sp. 3MP-14]